MKTIQNIALVALITLSNPVCAQNEEIDNREKFQFGLKAGGNYSNTYNSKTEEFESDAKFGFAGGLVMRIPLNTYLDIQPEALISQKGFKGNGVFLGTEYDFKRTTTYLDIPLQIALKPSEFISIVAGPQYSYLLKQKDEFNSTYFSSTQEEEFNNENVRKNIFGFVAGLDINLKHVILSSRMGWDFIKNHGDGSSSTPQYKNMWFQATIGYHFYK